MPSPAFRHAYKRVNGVRLHYVTLGATTGPNRKPLAMFLHGFPQNWYCWRKLMPLLADRYTCVAPDLRGFGDSQKPKSGYDKTTVATDIVELGRALGYERGLVIGQDWGGRTAWRIALDHPAFVEALVVMSAPYPLLRGERPFNPEIWYTRFFLIKGLSERMLRGNLGELAKHFCLRWSYKKHYTKADLAEYARAYSTPRALEGTLGHYRLLDWEQQNLWPKDAGRMVETPTLYMGGEKDPVSVFRNSDGIHRYVRDLRTAMVKGSGHFIQEESPREVAREIKSFLDWIRERPEK